ncbi:MAG TPA: CorA family divalent cation transporter, partial [Acidimicrobiia bacterium]|nr:CorA family divalent cation transporter [Acidimicrobiia bacterium]
DIRAIEDDVFSSKGDSERIYRLKQEVLSFHEAVEPLEEPLDLLATDDFKAIDPTLKPYFRDVLDHLLRVLSRINVYRDTLTSVLAANLTQVNLRQNEDMPKDLRLRGDRRHTDSSRRDLGDELRAHARDQCCLGLSGGTADHGRGLPLSIHPFQEERLALTNRWGRFPMPIL